MFRYGEQVVDTKPVAPLVDLVRNHARGYCCYGWFRGSGYLYIGATNNLKMRMCSHHVIGQVEEFLVSDELHLWDGLRPETLWVVERKLILIHQPKYNCITWKEIDSADVHIPKVKLVVKQQKQIKLRWNDKRLGALFHY